MPISPEYLPSELHYIIPLAELHGSDARIAMFDERLGRHVRYGEKLSAKAIEPLRKLYTQIRAEGHCELINRWHHSHWDKCPAETAFPIYGLLCLFAQLAELGIAPFNDGSVRPMEFPVELDWNKLPAPPSLLSWLGGGVRFLPVRRCDP